MPRSDVKTSSPSSGKISIGFVIQGKRPDQLTRSRAFSLWSNAKWDWEPW